MCGTVLYPEPLFRAISDSCQLSRHASQAHSSLREAMPSVEVAHGNPKQFQDKAGSQPCQSKHLGQCLLSICINSVNSGFSRSCTSGGYLHFNQKMTIIISFSTKHARNNFSTHSHLKPLQTLPTKMLRTLSLSNMRRVKVLERTIFVNEGASRKPALLQRSLATLLLRPSKIALLKC